MKTVQLTALAAAALLALTLAGCTPGTSTDTGSDSDTGSSDTETDTESTDDGGFVGATLSGTGDYSVPDQAPIGSYELPDNQDGLPDGCTWTLYEDENVLAESQGSFLFITDVTTRFVTDGCPDWVQYE